MACQTSKYQLPAVEPTTTQLTPTAADLLKSAIVFISPIVPAPFPAIRNLFTYLGENPAAAVALNDTYPLRGVFKTAAAMDPICDQKLTIDLSPTRVARIPPVLQAELGPHGLADVLTFFTTVTAHHVPQIMAALSVVAGRDLAALHAKLNVNFRLVDYDPETASPASRNGCGAHTDYGTFSIIFQDGIAGLEMEAPEWPQRWVPVPGDATVFLCGWCAVMLSGGKIRAVRHRVRRVPGVRRLSAVLFVAPDLDVKMAPKDRVESFSEVVNAGQFDVRWFKEAMGKKWRYREGNEKLEAGKDGGVEQDVDVEHLIWK